MVPSKQNYTHEYFYLEKVLQALFRRAKVSWYKLLNSLAHPSCPELCRPYLFPVAVIFLSQLRVYHYFKAESGRSHKEINEMWSIAHMVGSIAVPSLEDWLPQAA